MPRRLPPSCCLLLAVAALAGAAPTRADEPPRPILTTQGFWRVQATLRPAVYGRRADPEPRGRLRTPAIPAPPRAPGQSDDGGRVPAFPPDQPSSPLPPADWTRPDFDDSAWWRTPGPVPNGPLLGDLNPYDLQSGAGPLSLALLCVRGRFTVADPARVRDLRLSLAFRGGAAVYLNGREVARRFLPAGPLTPLTLADDLPDEAVARPDGQPLHPRDAYKARTAGDKALADELDRRLMLRVRRLDDLALPAELLRPGVNVLAIEIHRGTIRTALPYCPAGLVSAELSAGGGDQGAQPHLAPPRGVRVWNADLLADVLETDYPEPGDPLRPVRIVATPNGTFSGQVVVSSDRAIEGLSADVGPLARQGGAGAIAAGNVAALFPAPVAGAGQYQPARLGLDERSKRGVSGFGPLAESPPATVAPGKHRGAQPPPAAVQPIWVRVRVPRDAAAGEYRGTLTVRFADPAGAASAVSVPVCVTVGRWPLPAGRDFTAWTDFVESPESLALRYDVPPWTERHFELIERSFRLLGEAGNKTVYVPLISMTHFGNEQTMVRWIAGPDGTWRHDFSVMERYLDACEAQCGRPRVVCLYVYDYNLGTAGRHSGYATAGMGWAPAAAVRVSVLDPAAGRVSLGQAPRYGAAGSAAAWRPLADELAARMRRRGLSKAMMLGLVGDLMPPEPCVQFWADLMPWTPWCLHAHNLLGTLYGRPIGYQAVVYSARYGADPSSQRLAGWRRQDVATTFPRLAVPAQPRAMIRLLAEWNLAGRQNGLGRLAADFFPVLPDGRRLCDRAGLDCNWAAMNVGRLGSWLAPGPNGPTTTIRFELLREALQECEARIFIERAMGELLARNRMGDELADRCQRLLDERTRHGLWVFSPGFMSGRGTALPGGPMPAGWFADGGWQRRSAELFAAAAEVADAIADRGPTRP